VGGGIVSVNPVQPVVIPMPPAPSPAVLTAFRVPPPSKGRIAVGGFVSDPAGQLQGLPLVVVINWGDGTETFTGLVAASGGYYFVPQTHRKPKGHKKVTVHVERFVPAAVALVDVSAPFAVAT
jgi:hypothetical protein